MSNDNSKYCIALVDNEEIELFILQRLLKLKKLDTEIHIYRSGAQLISAITDAAIQLDFVLLNFKLNRGTGLDVLTQIENLKRQNKIARLPHFIITSSTTDIEDLLQIREHKTVSGFLSKPIMPSRLEALLHAVAAEK